MQYLTTADVAAILNVSMRRVQALIASGRLKAQRAGRDWLIHPKHLNAVRIRKPGRPSIKS